MKKYKVWTDKHSYEMYVGINAGDEDLTIIISSDNVIYAVIEYIICGGDRYDYNITRCYGLTIDEIETMLEQFRKQVEAQ